MLEMHYWCALCNDANHVLVEQVIRMLEQYNYKGLVVVPAMLSQ